MSDDEYALTILSVRLFHTVFSFVQMLSRDSFWYRPLIGKLLKSFFGFRESIRLEFTRRYYICINITRFPGDLLKLAQFQSGGTSRFQSQEAENYSM